MILIVNRAIMVAFQYARSWLREAKPTTEGRKGLGVGWKSQS